MKDENVKFKQQSLLIFALNFFEFVYFARPDSVIEGASVHEARQRALLEVVPRTMESSTITTRLSLTVAEMVLSLMCTEFSRML